MRRRSALAALLAVPAGVVTAGCDDDDPPPLKRLVIAAGQPDVAYARLGGALADAARKRWKIPVDVLPTSGSVDNVNTLMKGAADVAFTTVDVAVAASNGDSPFQSARPIAALASLYDDYLHIVVRDNEDITSIPDLAGKKVSTGLEDSAVDILASRVLGAATLTGEKAPARVNQEAADAAEQLNDREIDAFFTIGGLPDALVERLSTTLPIRLLPVEVETAALRQQLGEYFVTRSIPANTYRFESDVVTLGVRTILVVRRNAPDDVAYRLVRLLFEARDALSAAHKEALRLDERSALWTYPIELHPGVEKYYREVKLLA